jgi:hypothetical protein
MQSCRALRGVSCAESLAALLACFGSSQSMRDQSYSRLGLCSFRVFSLFVFKCAGGLCYWLDDQASVAIIVLCSLPGLLCLSLAGLPADCV